MAAYRTPERPQIRVSNHRGEAQENAVYWRDPPPEIGVLRSAWSNQDKDGWVRKQKLAPLVLLLGLSGLCAAALVYGAYDWLGTAGAVATAVVIAAFVCFAYVEGKQRPWCNYLGEDGFAEFKETWRGPRVSVVLFKNVAGLLHSRVEHYQNGVYQHTKHEYEWLSHAGPRVFKAAFNTHDKGFAAAGARFGSGGETHTPEKDFAEAASARWHELRTESALGDFYKHGVVVFPTARGGHFSVRENEVETTGSGKAFRLQNGEPVSQQLKAGILTIKTGAGKHRLVPSEIADHSIAFALAERFSGIDLAG
jgi:hypothetical protein